MMSNTNEVALKPTGNTQLLMPDAANAQVSCIENTQDSAANPTRPTIALSGVAPKEWAANIPDDETLKKVFGVKTNPGALGILTTALNALGLHGASYRDFILAMGAELEPRDAIEAMFVTQLAVLHTNMMEASKNFWEEKNTASQEAYDRIQNRLARTFSNQLEGLRRYRSGSSHVVRVEHVTVNAGGQAIVGNVSPTGGKSE